MGVRDVLAVFLLFMASVETQETSGTIDFWRKKVTLTCPLQGEVKFYLNENEIGNEAKYTFEYEGKVNDPYHCKNNEPDAKPYFFYMKGKVCENCFELDATMFGLVIVLDVIGTAVVMLIIYRCTNKKGSAGTKQSPKPPSRSGQPPATPSRDYEPLNVHTRSQDTYSVVNRTG